MSNSTVNDEIYWYSVVGALVPIALNSMAQPAGIIRADVSAEESFYDRFWPVTCLRDGLFVLIRYLFYLSKTRRPILAARFIARERLEDIAPPKDIRSVQGNAIIRAAFFTLAVLPQVIKLYATQGIPWTWAIATMYLTSFIVLEVIVVASGRLGELSDTDLKLHFMTRSSLFDHCVRIFQTLLQHLEVYACLYAMVMQPPLHPRPLYSGLPQRKEELWIPLAIMIAFTTGLTVTAEAYYYGTAQHWTSRCRGNVLFCFMVSTQSYFELRPLPVPEHTHVVCFILANVCFHLLFKYTVLCRDRKLESYRIYLLSNLMIISFRYRHSWQATGTLKPAWIRFLG